MMQTPAYETQVHKNTAASDGATRFAGAAFILGGVVTGVFNALHPLPSDGVEATLRGMLDSGVLFWKLDHLMLMAGFWLIAWGFTGVHHATRASAGHSVVRYGYVGLLMTTAAWTLHAALDGFARVEIAASWDAATGASRDTWFGIATSMQHITDATFPMITVFYGISLGVIGAGMAVGDGYPRWFGVALVVISSVLVVLGIVAIFRGFSLAWDLLFATFVTLTVVWTLVAGAFLVRSRRSGA